MDTWLSSSDKFSLFYLSCIFVLICSTFDVWMKFNDFKRFHHNFGNENSVIKQSDIFEFCQIECQIEFLVKYFRKCSNSNMGTFENEFSQKYLEINWILRVLIQKYSSRIWKKEWVPTFRSTWNFRCLELAINASISYAIGRGILRYIISRRFSILTLI